MSFVAEGAWEEWLRANHTLSAGLWLKIAKKNAGIETVSYAGALEVALCYGWIDGQKASAEDGFWLQKFTPRGKRSRWSKLNCDRVAVLTEAGRMQPAGQAEVDRAIKDGRWDAAYDSPRNAKVPDDFQTALAANPEAEAFFATLDGANRYAVLYRIQEAKKPETRSRRIERLIAMLNDHVKIHP
jgi:uncharacterized protein YdeI (YjbR/CyaY-like superfamily)